MVAVFPEFSVNISQKRWACVIDPALALSPFGLPLIKRLGAVMEVWMAREHWHIIDNTHVYVRWPEKLHSDARLDASSNAWPSGQAVLRALQEWEQIRVDTDPGKMKLYWIGDGPGESILPDQCDASIVWRFEALSSSLDNRLKSKAPLVSAFRDAVALAVTLPSALILTQLNGADDPTPLICQNIMHWNLDFERVDARDDWLKVEREFLQQHLVWAGLAKLRWSGMKLAVLHLVAPMAAMFSDELEQGLDIYGSEFSGVEGLGESTSETDYWQGAKGYWYPL